MAKKVLFVTGMAGDSDTRDFLEQTGQPFLKKPVDAKQLVQEVRKMTGNNSLSNRLIPPLSSLLPS